MTSIAALLEEIMLQSRERQVTLVIDEFQRLAEIDEGIINRIQDVWNRHHREVNNS